MNLELRAYCQFIIGFLFSIKERLTGNTLDIVLSDFFCVLSIFYFIAHLTRHERSK